MGGFMSRFSWPKFSPNLVPAKLAASSTARSEREATPRLSSSGPLRPAGFSAADIVDCWDQRELRRVFAEYGGEPEAGRIAGAIVRRRAREPFLTGDDLGRFVFGVKQNKRSRSSADPATRVFQALRI